MINGMDVEYALVCVNYVKEWIETYEVSDWALTQDEIEYIILKGGDGIRDLENSFQKLVKVAKEQKVTKIDLAFIDKVLS